MVWKSVISDVGIKLVDNTSWSLGEIKVANTLVNEWEEISFDFSDHVGIAYDQIVIFPDFNARSSDNIIYFDNISFSPEVMLDAPMTAAPDPTIDPANVISMFSGVYTNVPVDTWLAAWSVANYNEIQIDNNDTKKYEDLDYAGIETTGANIIDAANMAYFHIDVWTPNMTTFRVKLVDFGADGNYAGGDDSEHEIVFDNPQKNSWISYSIPLSDFTGLASRTHLAQLILSGKPAGEGVVYIDNVYYSNTPNAVNEFHVGTFEMFPNPTNNDLTIISDKIIESIKVYDTKGVSVWEEKRCSENCTLITSQLEPGIYTILVLTDGQTITKRFIKY